MEQADRESRYEFATLVKSVRVPLKEWYTNSPEAADLRKKHGSFPLFAKDLEEWKPFREVHKAFQAVALPKDRRHAPEASATSGRKRRSRWGAEKPVAPDGGKRSRWGNGAGAAPSGGLAPSQQRMYAVRLQLEVVNKKLLTVVQDAARAEADPRRSPSPEPVYDGSGKRTNTREVRMRNALAKERAALMDELVKLNPALRSSGLGGSAQIKRKIYIPVKDYPGYNFIGLIIGPRGNTQKRMERETGCKIAIRGKGSVKEGRGRRNPTEDEHDDLHVVVTGSSEASVEKASRMVEDLLRPVDDDANAHKKEQLRELAIINGTLRDESGCTICGETGHRQWQCPKDTKTRSYQMANVRCKICGDGGHPTSDCPMKGRETAREANADEADFRDFIAEVGGGKREAAPETGRKEERAKDWFKSGREANPPAVGYQAPQVPAMPMYGMMYGAGHAGWAPQAQYGVPPMAPQPPGMPPMAPQPPGMPTMPPQPPGMPPMPPQPPGMPPMPPQPPGMPPMPPQPPGAPPMPPQPPGAPPMPK